MRRLACPLGLFGDGHVIDEVGIAPASAAGACPGLMLLLGRQCLVSLLRVLSLPWRLSIGRSRHCITSGIDEIRLWTRSCNAWQDEAFARCQARTHARSS